MKVLITGGAGFIGCNLAASLLREGHQVTILDNFSRPGSEKNLSWLRSQGGRLIVTVADVRDRAAVKEAVDGVDVVYHFAAQVAVTSSIVEPRFDLAVNIEGTFNVLEAARSTAKPPIVLFTSTNKVYGELAELDVVRDNGRYAFGSKPKGIDESQSLCFHSPYGCSKGAADQYVLDYSRIYGLRTVVFRMSCIYGTRQFGNEDQGWVAHFVISAMKRDPLVIYGDGRQVRDVLFVEDLVQAFNMAIREIDSTAGKAYNIGGGSENTTSLNELIGALEKLHGRTVDYSYSEWRPGDQKVYVSDISRAYADFGWKPRIKMEEGIRRLVNWVAENREMFNAEPEATDGILDLTDVDVFKLRGAARSSGIALLQSVTKQQRF